MNESNPWKYFVDNQRALEAMPTDRDFEILFDNGDTHKYSDENFPFALIIAWREIETN